MKRLNLPVPACVVVLLCVGPVSLGASRESSHVVGVGARLHVAHSVFDEYPFGKSDLSYGINYQYHEGDAYWQLGLDYAPRVSRTSSDTGDDSATEWVLTPYLNLIARQDLYRAGIGVLRSLVHDERDDEDWSPVYWQLLMVLNFPILRGGVDLVAFYVFQRLEELADFKPEDVEFGCFLNFAF